MNQIINSVKGCQRAFLASHASPDGDAIGSLLALGLSLNKIGIQTTMYNESTIPAVYRFLSGVDRISPHCPDPEAHDLAVILDCGDLSRIGGIETRIGRIATILNIDHHITNTRFGTYQLLDVNASSTAEIVYQLIRQLEIPLDRAIATAIYTGILTDTGSFRFSNTNQAAFAISEKMVREGVDPHQVAGHVYGTYSLGRIKLLNLALDSIEISKNGKMSVMTLTQEMLKKTGTHSEDIDGLIHYAKRIEDVKIAALIQELKNGNPGNKQKQPFHVSLRSDGTVDVASIASTFGGGGHISAAGFSIDETMDGIKEIVNHLAGKI